MKIVKIYEQKCDIGIARLYFEKAQSILDKMVNLKVKIEDEKTNF
jgi:hypothetical protein